MNAHSRRKPHGIHAPSIGEKIQIYKKQLPPEKDSIGPTTDLFFHELERKPDTAERARDLACGTLLYILYLISIPIIGPVLKLYGASSIFQTFTAEGYNALPLSVRLYNTELYHPGNQPAGNRKLPLLLRILKRTGAHKLPLSRNLLAGEITYYGPEPLDHNRAMAYIDRYTDFYKRYAVLPGLCSPGSYLGSADSIKVFRVELRSIVRKTGSKIV